MTQTGFIQFGDDSIYYETAGSGATVVLCHAGFVDSGMWDTQWSRLTEHYQVVRYDMRGYGQSSPVNGPVSRREELRAVLDALDIERVYLAGCSLGGELALDFTLETPERVAGLVLVSATPGGFEMQGEPPALLMEMIQSMQTGNVEQSSELQIRLWVDGIYRQPEQVNPVVRDHALTMNRIPVTQANFFMEEANPLHPAAVDRLGDIHVPTLVIAGALDHPEILRAADVLATHITGAQKAILPDCAHVPNMEQPEAFNALLLDFLQNAQKIS